MSRRNTERWLTMYTHTLRQHVHTLQRILQRGQAKNSHVMHALMWYTRVYMHYCLHYPHQLCVLCVNVFNRGVRTPLHTHSHINACFSCLFTYISTYVYGICDCLHAVFNQFTQACIILNLCLHTHTLTCVFILNELMWQFVLFIQI